MQANPSTVSPRNNISDASAQNGNPIFDDSVETPLVEHDTQEPESSPRDKQRRSLTGKVLPPPRLSVSKQLEILRGHAISLNQHGRSSNTDVARIVGMHPNNSSAPNTFFESIGFLVRDEASGRLPAPAVLDYTRAYEWSPETAASKLAPLIARSWFGQTVMPIVSLRPRAEADVIAELAVASQAPIDGKSQLVMLLEYLEVAEMVTRRDGMIVKHPPRSMEKSRPDPQTDEQPTPRADVLVSTPPIARTGPQAASSATPINGIRYSVTINVNMEEMATWGADRIAAFFHGLAQVIAAEKGSVQTKN